jgi:hypothetical protein
VRMHHSLPLTGISILTTAHKYTAVPDATNKNRSTCFSGGGKGTLVCPF